MNNVFIVCMYVVFSNANDLMEVVRSFYKCVPCKPSNVSWSNSVVSLFIVVPLVHLVIVVAVAVQKAGDQKQEMEVLKGRQSEEAKKLEKRKKAIEVELSEIEPLVKVSHWCGSHALY